MQPPAYYRARIQAICEAIKQADQTQVKFLRNGYAPDLTIGDFSRFDNNPLSFVEICSFDTFFQLYPHKVCGETQTTTSRAFPLKVTGSKEEVIRVIRGEQQTESTRIRIAKARLKLLQFNF